MSVFIGCIKGAEPDKCREINEDEFEKLSAPFKPPPPIKERLRERALLFIETYKGEPDFKERKAAYWEHLKIKLERLEPYMKTLQEHNDTLTINFKVLNEEVTALNDIINRAKMKGKEGVWLKMEDAERLANIAKTVNMDSIVLFSNIRHLVEL